MCCNDNNSINNNIDHWFGHVPKGVATSHENKVDILRNQQVQTDRPIHNNKPDIIILDNEKGTCVLMDIAISDIGKCSRKKQRRF